MEYRLKKSHGYGSSVHPRKKKTHQKEQQKNKPNNNNNNPPMQPQLLIKEPQTPHDEKRRRTFQKAPHAKTQPVTQKLVGKKESEQLDFKDSINFGSAQDNQNFLVYGVIGQQESTEKVKFSSHFHYTILFTKYETIGVGKSTLMNKLYNFLAGTSEKDPVPFPTQTDESQRAARHTTVGVDLYTFKEHFEQKNPSTLGLKNFLLLDSQPFFSSSILYQMIAKDSFYPNETTSHENWHFVQSVQLCLLLFSICNVVVICQEDESSTFAFWKYLKVVEGLKKLIPNFMDDYVFSQHNKKGSGSSPLSKEGLPPVFPEIVFYFTKPKGHPSIEKILTYHQLLNQFFSASLKSDSSLFPVDKDFLISTIQKQIENNNILKDNKNNPKNNNNNTNNNNHTNNNNIKNNNNSNNNNTNNNNIKNNDNINNTCDENEVSSTVNDTIEAKTEKSPSTCRNINFFVGPDDDLFFYKLSTLRQSSFSNTMSQTEWVHRSKVTWQFINSLHVISQSKKP